MKSAPKVEITPFVKEGNLIISIDHKWIEFCNGIPKFTVLIDRSRRLVLLGPKLGDDANGSK